MATSNILIVGLNGVGVEVAKNIILAGVKSVTLLDNEPTSLLDLSSQFYLTEADVGKPRAQASHLKLAELNQYVKVNCHQGDLSEDVLKAHGVVVMCDGTFDKQVEINNFCHTNGIKFIAVSLRGPYGYCFTDLGENFVVNDTNGEEPLSAMIASITNDKEGLVTCLDDHRHGFESGDFVTFREVGGMSLNESEPREVSVKGPYTFTIGDTTNLGTYTSGGYVTQVKMPKTIHFKSMTESAKNPESVISDFAKFDRPAQLNVAFQALSKFQAAHGGALPESMNKAHAEEVLKITKEINDALEVKADLDDELIRRVSYFARGNLSPMAATFGGIVGQEIMKAVSGKFHPIYQWLFLDIEEALTDYQNLPEAEFKPQNSRYDGQIAVFGSTFQTRLQNARYFLVGAGAIGCEMLKNWAMMGLGTGPQGMIHITDMDTIEKSNLNRQFLFRANHVTRLKAEVAAEQITAMNPQMKIKSYNIRVGPESEELYNDEFFENLDGVCNALDNVQARLYMDQRCVYYKKPLLESGTLGTKGNVQVVVPFLTESYGSSRDPPEKSIPICTLKNFPNAIEHTLQWSRDTFEGMFNQSALDVNGYLSDAGFIDNLDKQGGTKRSTLENLKECLVSSRPVSFNDCIVWARLRFEEYYNNSIRQLLHVFPPDMVNSQNLPFWSGPKRCPNALTFDANDETHMGFVIAAANLRAVMFGLKGETNIDLFKQVVADTMVPEFTPKSGVKIQVNENEQQPSSGDDDDEVCSQILKDLPTPSDLAGFRLNPVEFEKDDDTNFHMDFITACSNLRARNYRIEEADKHRSKLIAGKIIPAIATTTALVTGLVCTELYKLKQEKAIEAYKNGFINLALPFFGFSEPIPAPKFGRDWTLWHSMDVKGDITLQEFLDHFEKGMKLEVGMISYGPAIVYSSFTQRKKIEERLPLKMSEVCKLVSKKDLPAYSKYLVFEICCNDENDEDVETPYVRYQYKD
eukprot:GFYU01002025.1.p1 GENE.GFYU01002025.1~~GFYU01002025.1.p1  ORF type:complete len:1022 (+),score=376.66 GFYU01002025.1:139-3066(+)